MTIDKSKLPSRHVTQGPQRAPHRSYYYAMGLTDDEIQQPFVGVASCWNEAAPCNISLMRQAQAVKKGVTEARGTAREFCTITVTDGIAMGHQGMKSSLVSREVIADSVELTMRGHCYDALVGLAGCDKSLPGMMMAMLRLNVPSIFMYGGSILPGRYQGRDVTVQDVFEAVGQHSAGNLSDDDLHALECVACPGAGACGGQYTANTMACVSEAIGLALPYSAGSPAVYESRDAYAEASGKAVMDLIESGLRPRDIVTRKALENAATVVAASGGSTNAGLHLPAMAHEAGIAFDLMEVAKIFKRTPYIADLKPGGRYVAKDMFEVGGVPLLLKALLDGGYLHGDCLTVTGKTMAENLADLPGLAPFFEAYFFGGSTGNRLLEALFSVYGHHIQDQMGATLKEAAVRQNLALRAEKAALQHELADMPVGPMAAAHVGAAPVVATLQGGAQGDEMMQRAAASCASYHQLSIFQQPAADAAAADAADAAAADAAAAVAFERMTAPPSPQLSGLHFLRLPGSPGPKAAAGAAAGGAAWGAAGGAAEAERGERGARVLDLPGEAALLFERFEAVSPG